MPKSKNKSIVDQVHLDNPIGYIVMGDNPSGYPTGPDRLPGWLNEHTIAAAREIYENRYDYRGVDLKQRVTWFNWPQFEMHFSYSAVLAPTLDLAQKVLTTSQEKGVTDAAIYPLNIKIFAGTVTEAAWDARDAAASLIASSAGKGLSQEEFQSLYTNVMAPVTRLAQDFAKASKKMHPQGLLMGWVSLEKTADGSLKPYRAADLKTGIRPDYLSNSFGMASMSVRPDRPEYMAVVRMEPAKKPLTRAQINDLLIKQAMLKLT